MSKSEASERIRDIFTGILRDLPESFKESITGTIIPRSTIYGLKYLLLFSETTFLLIMQRLWFRLQAVSLWHSSL